MIDPKECDLNKYSSSNSKEYAFEVDLEYPKDLQELHNNYPLAPNKIEVKREMLSAHQLKIADLYNISIGNVKELVSNFFDKEKYVLHSKNLQLCLRLGLQLKKYINFRIRIQLITMIKAIYWLQQTKNKKSRKKWTQRSKSVIQITEQCYMWKKMENVRNRINPKLVNSEKDYLKSTSKQAPCRTKYLTII